VQRSSKGWLRLCTRSNNCRQSRADKFKLLEPYFSRSVSHGLHRGASKHVYDSTCNAVRQFDEVLDESLIDRQGRASDGRQCQVSGNEAAYQTRK